MSELMDIITDCENRLGWLPDTSKYPIWKVRAIEHRKLMKAMEKHSYTERDLRLALNYLIRRREGIQQPLHLIGLVPTARELAAPVIKTLPLTERIEAAIFQEQTLCDDASEYWIGRLIRCVGPARDDVLTEWAQARMEEEL